MDIQDDKDFAALPEVAKLYQACKERDLTIAEREYLKGARDAWQAKAQAVPEGFVLVPREMPKSFDEGLYVYSNSISIVDECSDGFIPMSDINHAEVWKLVIEAQEQANESE